MKSFINIEIKDSFNKKDDSRKNIEDNFGNVSTLNNHKDISEISSMSMGSVTSGQLQRNFQYAGDKKYKNGFWREVLIGVISGVIGTILGTIATYFILGAK